MGSQSTLRCRREPQVWKRWEMSCSHKQQEHRVLSDATGFTAPQFSPDLTHGWDCQVFARKMASQAATDEAKHPDGAATAKEFVVVVDDGVSLAASLHAKDLARFEAVGNAVKSVQPEVCVDVDTSAPRCAVLCHGLLGRRSSAFLPQLRTRLLEGTVDAVVLYDSRGNGDSTGQASIAGYHRDVRDLACVVAGLRACGLRVEAVVGHSRGANVVLLHAAQWCSGSARVPLVCAIAPRFDMAALPLKYFTPQQRASVGFGRDASSGVGASAGSGSGEAGEQGSFVWHTWSSRNPAVPVTRAHLEEVSSLDMRRQCCLVPPTTRVLLCHGYVTYTAPPPAGCACDCACVCTHSPTLRCGLQNKR